MMRFGIAILIVAAFSPRVLARIGETEKEIEARYGIPSRLTSGKFTPHDELGNVIHEYLFHGFKIHVVFESGKSVLEIFSHDERAISDAESLAILGAYGDIWKVNKVLSEKPNYPPITLSSQDGKLAAVRAGSVMEISVVGYGDRVAAKRKQLETDRLKGF